MGRAKRGAVRAGNYNRVSGRGFPAIQHIARENPGMSGGQPISRFAIDPNSMQTSSVPVSRCTVQRMACRRAIRSSVDGCVENIRIRL